MSEPQWGVAVNETAIYMHGAAAVWWGVYRTFVLDRSGNPPCTLTGCAFGDLVFVPCGSREHAMWLRDLIWGNGAPKKAAKAQRDPGARKAGDAA